MIGDGLHVTGRLPNLHVFACLIRSGKNPLALHREHHQQPLTILTVAFEANR